MIEYSDLTPRDDDVNTVEDVAAKMKCSVRTVYSLLRAGELRGFRVGREWRVTNKQLSEFMDRPPERPDTMKATRVGREIVYIK